MPAIETMAQSSPFTHTHCAAPWRFAERQPTHGFLCRFFFFYCLLAKADVLTPPSSSAESHTPTPAPHWPCGLHQRASLCTLSGYSGRKKELFSHPPGSSVPGLTALSQNGTTRGPLLHHSGFLRVDPISVWSSGQPTHTQLAEDPSSAVMYPSHTKLVNSCSSGTS